MTERKFIGYVDVYPNSFTPTSVAFASRYSTPFDVVKLYSDCTTDGNIRRRGSTWYHLGEPLSPFMQSKFNDAVRDYVLYIMLEEKE